MNRQTPRKLAALLAVWMVCFALPGCGEKTHTWVEATCTEPRTCSGCGETEGLPLGHDPGQANYQSPALCSRCGIAVGDALEGELAELKVKTELVLGKETPYETCCTSTAWHKTTGRVQITSDQRLPLSEIPEQSPSSDARAVASDDNSTLTGDASVAVGELSAQELIAAGSRLQAAVPADWQESWAPALQDGSLVLEYHRITAHLRFNDTNAVKYGVHISPRLEDWYTATVFDTSAVYDTASGCTSHIISWYGRETQLVEKITCIRNEWQEKNAGSEVSFDLTLEVIAPQGYDGLLLGFFQVVKGDDETMTITDLYDGDNMLFYRSTLQDG